MKNDIRKFQTYKNFKNELLKDPEFKKEYEKIDPRYEAIKQTIEARIKSGLTQKEIADRMGTKQSALARFESGNYNPSLEFLQRLAKALNTTFTLKIS